MSVSKVANPRMRRFFLGLFALAMAWTLLPATALAAPKVSYKSHVQSSGWMTWKADGALSGTTGQSKRLEAFLIKISGVSGSIEYRAHVENVGWQGWKANGAVAGTTGKSLQVEAIQVRLKGIATLKYDVYYRVHVARVGWLGWTKNGGVAGTTGMANRIEAIQVKLVSKTSKSKPSTATPACLTTQKLSAQAHVQTYGWLKGVSGEAVIGTTGKGKRLEGLRLSLKDLDGKGNVILVKAHVAGEGWQTWRRGTLAGTTGKSRAIEAVQIVLDGKYGKVYDVYYRMHVADYGWLGWAKNGATAGTTSGGVQAEALQIKLVPKSRTIATGGAACLDLSKTTGIRLQHHLTCSLNQHVYGTEFSKYGCMAMAYTVGLSALGVGEYNPTAFFAGQCYTTKGHINYPSSPFDATSIYNNLKAGKPALVHYIWSGGQHWVCVIGIRAGAPINNLQPSDFIVIDPSGGAEKMLSSCGSFGLRSSLEMRLMY